MNLRTKSIQQFFNTRRISTGRRENQLSCIQRRAFYCICQFQVAAVNQFFWNCLVVAFRILLCKVFRENIMTCTCQTIATHTAVIFFFISSLSVRSQTYDNVSRTDICIVNYISTFHAACHCTVDNNSTNQVTNIGSFTSCCINTYSHFSQFGKQFVCSVDDSRNHFTRNQQFITSDS